ncbi:MAG: PEGA domain-containing protein [Deltaproteobacteria bacterium]|nr:PEGA domain-containing protein [Deltaproteobacteria bacterium]
MLLVFACNLTVAATVEAQPQRSADVDLATEAQLHFDLGVDAYRRGAFQEALEHLLLSNRLVPNKNVVFNIARCFEQLQRYGEAFRYYTDFLDVETDATERDGAQRAIERIRPNLALLRIETNPAGATIFIDRRDLGQRGASPRTLALEAGRYRVIADLEGYEPAMSGQIEVRTGETATVSLSLSRILGRVRVEGQPRGAEIRVDEDDSAPVGRVPTTLELTPGPHVLIVSAPGRQTLQRVVRVAAGQLARASVSLPLAFGTLVLDGEERGAEVELDGRVVGTLPLTLNAIPSGAHRIRVTAPGFRPYEEDVTVAPDRRTVVEVRLRLLREVTAASRSAESVEDAPASVTLIPEEEIRAFGYQTLYEAIGGTRGVFQSDDRTYSYLGFRGFARPGDYGNRVLVLLDGHTMNDDQLGSSYVSYDQRADLLDIERIEVVRGPGSVLYGSNAFFGVLNLVTRDADTMLRPNVSIVAEGVRTARARVGAGARFSRTAGAWLSLGGVASQGEDLYFPEYEDELPGGVARDVDGFRAGSVGARGWLGDFTLQLSYNIRRKDIPTGSFDTIIADDRAFSEDQRSFAELRWEPRLSRQIRLYARAYADRYSFRGVYPYSDDDGGPVRDNWDGTWTGLEARVVADATSWLRLTVGAETRLHFHANLYSYNDEDGGANYLDEEPTFSVFSGYALVGLTPARIFSAQVGARLDFYSLTGDNYPRDSDLAISPRLALIVRPSERDTLKLLGGSAFRAPSPYEYFYNDGGSTQIPAGELDAETIYTGELEYTRRVRDDLFLVGSVFFNQINDLIDTIDVPNPDEDPDDPDDDTVIQYQNLEDPVRTVGFEAEVRREWRQGWMIAASYSFQRTRIGSPFDDDLDVDDDGDGENDSSRLSNSPEHMFSLKAAAPIVTNLATLASRLRLETGRRSRELTSDTETDPAILWDIVLSGGVERIHLTYALGVRNVLDWEHGHPGGSDLRQLSITQPGRTFFAQATFTW